MRLRSMWLAALGTTAALLSSASRAPEVADNEALVVSFRDYAPQQELAPVVDAAAAAAAAKKKKAGGVGAGKLNKNSKQSKEAAAAAAERLLNTTLIGPTDIVSHMA